MKAIFWKSLLKIDIKAVERWKSTLINIRAKDNYHLYVCNCHCFTISPFIFSLRKIILEKSFFSRNWFCKCNWGELHCIETSNTSLRSWYINSIYKTLKFCAIRIWIKYNSIYINIAYIFPSGPSYYLRKKLNRKNIFSQEIDFVNSIKVNYTVSNFQ